MDSLKAGNGQGKKALLTAAVFAAVCILITGCSAIGKAADPAGLGYPLRVTYHALGGTINLQEVRTTYYAEGSYVFKPSGSAGMLVDPVREGFILAGWYTAKEAAADGYSFRAEDRWDFDEDRIYGDLDLYARWIPQSAVRYIDAETGAVLFTKNVTVDSPVQALSAPVEKLYTPAGKTLLSYYFDPACTEQCVFGALSQEELLRNNETIYEKLAQKFPEYIVPLEDGAVNAGGTGTPYSYIEEAGFRLTTTEEAVLKEIRAHKDTLIESSIASYLENSSIDRLYMKFIDGAYLRVRSPEQFKKGAEYSFANLGGNGIDGYIFTDDIDFGGAVLEAAPAFYGKIYGNGYALRNFNITAGGTKAAAGQANGYGLFESLSGAVIEDLHFEKAAVNIDTAANGSLYAALLAGRAENTAVVDCHFTDIIIKTGTGEQPLPYAPSDGGVCYLGDLFAAGSGNTAAGCTAVSCTFGVLGNVEINTLLFAQE